MANEQIFPEQRPYAQRLAGHGILRRRALALIVIGVAFTFMAGVNLDVFGATVGCIAVAAGGAWRWCLGPARRSHTEYSPRNAIAGANGKLYSGKVPATRRDPYFP
jgi:hypothetical protein